jgi:hypothetical protein
MLIIQNSEMRQICTFVKKNCLSFIKWGQKIPECDFVRFKLLKMLNSLKNDEKTFFSYKNLWQNEPFARKTARKNAFTAKMWEKKIARIKK